MKKFLVLFLASLFLGGCLTATEQRGIDSLDSRLSAVEMKISSVEERTTHKVFVGEDQVPPGNIAISGGKIVINE